MPFENLLPAKPVQRAISLGALAAAGCGGLYYAAQSGLLISGGLPVQPWQVLTLVSWAGNTAAIFSGGRLDGGGKGSSMEEPTSLPPVRFFSPAGWAFAIWGGIISGEMAMAVYQALPLTAVRASSGWLSQLSPWLGGTFLLQTCWCFSFREWARDSGLLWFPAALLGGTGVCLGGAHAVLRSVGGSMSGLQYALIHLPLSLHFGWISCATLVNLNGYLSLLPKFSDKALLRFSLTSIATGVSLAVVVTTKSGDPVYAGVVAWALSAIASEAGWKSMKGRVDIATLQTQQTAARIGAVICAATAAFAPMIMRMLGEK